MKLDKQIVNFIKVGVINTVFYYLLYSVLIFLGLNYKIAVFLATIIGILFSFKTFGKFVFNNEDKNLVFKFILVYIILYFVNIGLIGIFKNYETDLYISGLFATLLCAALSFILNKWYVFKK
jgi:putative flippase GtrA